MKLRIAKQSDYKILAKIHIECGKEQTGGFMFKLGLPFLKLYYKILLKEKHSIVLIAEDENDLVIGFVSGSISAEEHLKKLRDNKYYLAFSVLPSIIKSPKILKSLIERNSFIHSKKQSKQFGITSGVRMEYWAWKPTEKGALSIYLIKAWLNIIFSLGHTTVKGEVDLINDGILKIHKFLGAKVKNELNNDDGKKRVIIEYVNPNSK